MDSPEDDVSARVLLKRVLHTEQPRSPVTRSANKVRRSMRTKNTPKLENPGSALRQRLKKKLYESAVASPPPSPKRRRSAASKSDPPDVTPAPSTLFDEDMTTRGLLRGIIHMETETSLLMSGQPALQELEANPAESSVSSAGEKTEGLSGAELSDLTLHTEPLTHVVRGLSRRKQQSAFSVSAFEKQFDQLPDNTEDVVHVSQGGDVHQEIPDTSQDLDFSAGSKSGLNLTLKTPFVEKRSERAGLQRKVSSRRPPSVDAFDEAVQRFMEQGHNQEQSVFLAGKTLEDSSWQKFTLGLNDVTELYIQVKKDDTVGPSAEMDERENQGSSVSEVPNIQGSRVLNEDEMESPSLDDEEVEARHDVFLDTAYDIVLAPTQAMTDPQTADGDIFVNVVHEEVVEDVEHQNVEEIEGEDVEENQDAEHYPEHITRRAHRSEGEGAVLKFPAATRVTKSFGFGLNPREKDLLDLVDGSSENLEDVPNEERQTPGSPVSPQLAHLELANQTSEDAQEEEELTSFGSANQSTEPTQDEAEDIVESKPANQSIEPTTVEAEDIPEAEVANQSTEPTQDEAEEIMEAERTNQSNEPTQDEAEDVMESEPTNQSTELPEELEEEEVMELELANQSPEPEQEEEEEISDSEPANQSPEFVQEEEEDNDDDDDDARSAELSMKTPAFVKHRRVFSSPTTQPDPTVLKEVNAGPAPQVSRRAPKQKRQTETNVLPKSYIMSVFKHFAKTKVASDVYPTINEILKKYFDRLADDLETYAVHAKRKTIEVEDFELLMRRQGFVTDNMPVNVLIEKYLPLEYRKLLIPVATSGNKVIPTQRSEIQILQFRLRLMFHMVLNVVSL